MSPLERRSHRLGKLPKTATVTGAGVLLRSWRVGLALGLACCLVSGGVAATVATADTPPKLPNLQRIPDASGAFSTFSTAGAIDTGNAFFQSLGTNGRACATCHVPSDGWTITPADVGARFARTGGDDPIFRTNDGSNSPLADVSTVQARQAAYSMLLGRAVLRIGLSVPPGAQFQVTAVHDPYGYVGSNADPIGPAMTLSLFRRPLPATNLGFLSAVMWDGRETVEPLLPGNSAAQNAAALAADLAHQANDATLGHAQASVALTAEQQQDIVAFESGLFSTQVTDASAGQLDAQGANGGPVALSTQPFFIGINDPLGNNPRGTAFDANATTVFGAWSSLAGHDQLSLDRAAVARGESLFNSYPIAITGVAGLNDVLGQATIQGTCTTCHDTPNVGDHSVAAALNIGVADSDAPGLNNAVLPVYTIHCTSGSFMGVPTPTVQTTDPGRALITGRCADIGKVKGPILRNLAARAPYFQNGSAATLQDVVNFYNRRFDLNLTSQQQADLIAFLLSL